MLPAAVPVQQGERNEVRRATSFVISILQKKHKPTDEYQGGDAVCAGRREYANRVKRPDAAAGHDSH